MKGDAHGASRMSLVLVSLAQFLPVLPICAGFSALCEYERILTPPSGQIQNLHPPQAIDIQASTTQVFTKAFHVGGININSN